jgi:hypothetical protein
MVRHPSTGLNLLMTGTDRLDGGGTLVVVHVGRALLDRTTEHVMLLHNGNF